MTVENHTDDPILSSHRQYIIGTAGHIDHGKTALVKALTGVDTDRLPEEKARGITINLGFAHLGRNITFIDVPGHERLVKNMVAGVSTIDAVLLVIAADDGVMPQTREHLDIINLLQIQHGVVAISKIDLVEADWLQLVEEEVRELLRHTPLAASPIVRTSVTSAAGIAQLRQALFRTLAAVPPRTNQEVFRQPIDRVFSIKGYGTVVTGTVLSGHLDAGQEVEIQPAQPPLHVRVRGLQSHDAEVDRVKTGDRAAVNLAAVDVQSVRRGMVLVQPGLFEPAKIINARLHLLPSAPQPVKTNQRLRVHLHTAEAFARLILPTGGQLHPGQSAYVQLRMEQPVHAAFQDRFVIRQYSPQRTIGGGVVLQVNPLRYRKKRHAAFQETLTALESEDPTRRTLAAFDAALARPLTLWQLKIATALPMNDLQKIIKQLQEEDLLFAEKVGKSTVYFSRAQLMEVHSRVTQKLAGYHSRFPGRPGLKTEEIVSQLARFFLPETVRKTLQWGTSTRRLHRDGEYIRLPEFTPRLSAQDSEKYQLLETRYREAGFAPPTVKEVMKEFDLSTKEFKELSRLLREEGKLVLVDANLLFHSQALEKVAILLKNYFREKPEIGVPEFKELIGTTRKHAIPLLEYLDDRGITRRSGEVRTAGPRLS